MFDWEEAQRKLEEEHRDQLDEINKLKDILKKDIMLEQQSDKSEKLEIKYSKGRVTWKTNWIEGFALGHPEFGLMQYRTQSAPYVSFCLREEGLNDGIVYR
jgi:hypothetical protein